VPFAIPPHFKQAYELNVGINRTAAVFGAWDEDADILYLHSLHYAADAIAAIHADAIKARGKWLQGAIDPAARGRNPSTANASSTCTTKARVASRTGR
jgi:hypothetical protein